MQYMLCAEMDQAERDHEVQSIARQFKVIAGELISVLEQVKCIFVLSGLLKVVVRV